MTSGVHNQVPSSVQADDSLFQKMMIGTLEIKGRLTKSATVETLCSKEGFVTEALIQHYREMAQGGVPMIITGAASVNRYGRGVPHQIAVDHPDKVAGLKALAKAVTPYGTRLFVQLYHTGRQAIPVPVGRVDALAPSDVYEPSLGVKPRAMTQMEISDTVRDFADAAQFCKEAGIDGVQIHAAHGYLISSFLTPHTNRRKDEYGGSLEGRMRFLIEVYRAIRERVGEDYPVIMKLNGSDDLPWRNGLTTQELVEIAKRMEREGIDAVEISAGHYESLMTFERGNWRGYTKAMITSGPGQALDGFRRWAMSLFTPLMDWLFNRAAAYREGFNLSYAQQFSAVLSVPVICVGGLSTKASMVSALNNNQCDMVSVARGLLADPYLYKHLQSNKPGPQCDYCNACFTRPGVSPIGCYNPKVKTQRADMLAVESVDS